jgi:dephospho-CoA kinase
MKVVIGLTGKIASGKGTIKKYLVEIHNAEECRFSTVLRDILTRLNIENSRENTESDDERLNGRRCRGSHHETLLIVVFN